MLTKKQINILGSFTKYPFKAYMFSDIKRISGQRSNALVQDAIKMFLQENIVKEHMIGKTKLYTLNYSNRKNDYYLGLYVMETLPKKVIISLNHLIKEIEKKYSFYSIILFGSYANNSYSEKSDLDIALFIPNSSEKGDIEIAVNAASNKTLLELDVHIITEEEFKEMLNVDYENLGKILLKSFLPYQGTNSFYNLAKPYISHGLQTISGTS